MGFEEIKEIEDAEIVYEDSDTKEKELMNSFAKGELDFDKLGVTNPSEKRNYTKARITKKHKKIRAKMVKASRKKNRR